MVTIFFEDVKVPLTNLLGSEEGQGFYQLMKQLPWERLAIGIGALGNIDFALEETIKYVKDRPGHDLRYAINSNKIKDELNWKAKTKLNDIVEKMYLEEYF